MKPQSPLCGEGLNDACFPMVLPGSLLPVAFSLQESSDLTPNGPILDLLVTKAIPLNTMLGVWFYETGAPYTDPASASSASFIVSAALAPGSLLRVSNPSGTGLIVYASADNAATWTAVGTTTTGPVVPANASCMVYWAPCFGGSGSTVKPICFVGVNDGTAPVPPPCLPCEYAIIQPAVEANAMYAPDLAYIPGQWVNAWQVLKWGAPWEPTFTYATTVNAVEADLRLVLTPGQLLPVASKPFNYATPQFGGELALVATATIPANTVVYLRGGPWDPTSNVYDLSWTSPTVDLPPGTVIDLLGLGYAPGTLVRANVGTLVTLAALTESVADWTLFGARDVDAGLAVITALYTCGYTGLLPTQLQPGVSMPARPWPASPSILGGNACGAACFKVLCWPLQAVTIANSLPVPWFSQALPCYVTAPKTPCADMPSCLALPIMPSTLAYPMATVGSCGTKCVRTSWS
jgi:hypothetical protein